MLMPSMLRRGGTSRTLEALTVKLHATPQCDAANVLCPPFQSPTLPATFTTEHSCWVADVQRRGLCGKYDPADGGALPLMPFIHPSFWPARSSDRRCSMTALQCHGDTVIGLACATLPVCVGDAPGGNNPAAVLKDARHVHLLVCDRLQWGELIQFNRQLFRVAPDAAPPREVTVPCFVAAVGALYVSQGLQVATEFIVEECLP
jgi:hypothetical protein